MVAVFLVGEDAAGQRIIPCDPGVLASCFFSFLCVKPVTVNTIDDVAAAFVGWKLKRTSGYLLQGEQVTANINHKYRVEPVKLCKMLKNGMWVLYLVLRHTDESNRRVPPTSRSVFSHPHDTPVCFRERDTFRVG